MLTVLLVGLGGFIGAIARYGISSWVYRYTPMTFPYGTLVVNLLGCLLIGFLMTWSFDRLGPHWRMFAVTGLLGSLTTFSTFGYETLLLIDRGDIKAAILSVAANMVVGLLAVVVGRWLAHQVMA